MAGLATTRATAVPTNPLIPLEMGPEKFSSRADRRGTLLFESWPAAWSTTALTSSWLVMAEVILALSAAWIAGFPINGVTFATYRSVLETWLAAQTPMTDTGARTQPRMIATAATGARQRPRRGPGAPTGGACAPFPPARCARSELTSARSRSSSACSSSALPGPVIAPDPGLSLDTARSRCCKPRQSSCAKASRSLASWSSDRLVVISSASVPLNSFLTRSNTASELSRNRAEVPGVTLSLTVLMNESLIPTSPSEPSSAPVAAPMARPRIGMKKIRPNSRPQKPPPSSPPFFMSCICSVFGFLRPASQLTTAASRTWISPWACRPFSLSSAASAPNGVSNFQTVRDDMSSSPFHWSAAQPSEGAAARGACARSAGGRPHPQRVNLRGPRSGPPGTGEPGNTARSDQVQTAAAGDGGAPGGDAQLAVDRPQVGLDRVDRQEQGVRDLLVGQVGGQQPEHGQLAEGERRRLDVGPGAAGGQLADEALADPGREGDRAAGRRGQGRDARVDPHAGLEERPVRAVRLRDRERVLEQRGRIVGGAEPPVGDGGDEQHRDLVPERDPGRVQAFARRLERAGRLAVGQQQPRPGQDLIRSLAVRRGLVAGVARRLVRRAGQRRRRERNIAGPELDVGLEHPGRHRIEAALAHHPGQAAGGGDIPPRERRPRPDQGPPRLDVGLGQQPANGGGVGLIEQRPGRGEVIAVEGHLRGGEGDQARGVGIGRDAFFLGDDLGWRPEVAVERLGERLPAARAGQQPGQSGRLQLPDRVPQLAP